MNAPATTTFTAAQISEALGKAPRVIRRALVNCRADGERVVRGNLAATWSIASLPADMQLDLERVASSRGFRNAFVMLEGADVWQPEIPWNEVCAEQQAEALKLQRALLPTLTRRNEPGLSSSELDALGVREYEREFSGRTINAERWRYLFKRILERDRGAEQFSRIELYLPGNLKRSADACKPGRTPTEFESLNDCIARFSDPQKPTIDESDALWQVVVELFREEAGDSPKKFKRGLLNFLWKRASFLAGSENALRVNLDRKLKRVAESDGDTLTLLDGRRLKRGEVRADPIPQDDVDKIVWHSARNCGGRTAQAVRELGEQGARSGLSAVTLDLINVPHENSSHVNRRLFKRVHPEVELVMPYLLGKKAIDDATASLRRDYSNLHSMMALTADDFTMPVYSFVPDGKGWWILTRGQVLLMIDCRSLKIIGWSLQPERNYNSLVIRTLMNRTCRTWGIPRAWIFENGIWRRSRLVKGAPREWREGQSDATLKPGWEKLGVKFVHAKRARTKPAELVGGLLQNLMERVPGYCGRDERRDCPELTKRNKLAVEAHRIEPHGAFLSFDAWDAELAKLIATYNAKRQRGAILQGLSPDEAFEAHWPTNDPPMQMDASCWHLLAHYVSEREVKTNGIEFKIGAEKFVYRDANSSGLRASGKVLAWFDPDCPDVLGVTDLNERNPVLLRRDKAVDFLASLDRDSEANQVYQQELAKVAGHQSFPKARFHILQAKFEPKFRRNMVAPGVMKVGLTFAADRIMIEDTKRADNRRRSNATSRAQKLGLPSALVRNADDTTAAGLEMMARAEREMEAAENTPAPAPAKKDYVLKPFKGENK